MRPCGKVFWVFCLIKDIQSRSDFKNENPNTANAVKNDDGYPESLKRVQKITGKSLTFYELDIREKTKLEEVFEKHKIDSVLHFAGLKSVNESVSQPLEYYNNNISGQLTRRDRPSDTHCDRFDPFLLLVRLIQLG